MIHRLIIILGICLLFSQSVLAADMELRNPFLPPTIMFKVPEPAVNQNKVVAKTKIPEVAPKTAVKPKASIVKISSLNLKLKGIVWGEGKSQAIINDQVVSVGDVIKEAKVVSITRKGVWIVYQGVRAILTIDKKI